MFFAMGSHPLSLSEDPTTDRAIVSKKGLLPKLTSLGVGMDEIAALPTVARNNDMPRLLHPPIGGLAMTIVCHRAAWERRPRLIQML